MTNDENLSALDLKMLYNIRMVRGCYVRDTKERGEEPDPAVLREYDELVEFYRGLVSQK